MTHFIPLAIWNFPKHPCFCNEIIFVSHSLTASRWSLVTKTCVIMSREEKSSRAISDKGTYMYEQLSEGQLEPEGQSALDTGDQYHRAFLHHFMIGIFSFVTNSIQACCWFLKVFFTIQAYDMVSWFSFVRQTMSFTWVWQRRRNDVLHKSHLYNFTMSSHTDMAFYTYSTVALSW